MPEITLFTKKDIPAFVEFRHQSKKESPFLNDSNITLATEQQEEYTSADKKAYLLKDKDKIIGQLFIKYHPKTNTVGLGLISVLTLNGAGVKSETRTCVTENSLPFGFF